MTDHSHLLAELSEGIKTLTTSEQWTNYLKVQSAFHNYSSQNTMLILVQNPYATRVAGYNKWKSLGRQVRKGEKGIFILAPLVFKTERENGEVEKGIKGFRYVSVFDISQTDGEDLPEVATRLVGEDPTGTFMNLKQVASGLGFSVIDHEFEGETNGDCNHATKTIRVHTKNQPAQRVKTLAHEIAHAILHDPDEIDYRANRGLCELEAESTAFVVCRTLGIASDDYSFGYVAGWAGGGDEAVAAIGKSQARIQKAANAILKPWNNKE